MELRHKITWREDQNKLFERKPHLKQKLTGQTGALAVSGHSHSPDLSKSRKMNKFYQKIREEKIK